MSEFYALGAVPIGSAAHVPRAFEDEAAKELFRGSWVLLLGPRQHGKTTGIVRILKSLRDSGLITSRVDLQGLPPVQDYSHVLRSVVQQVLRNQHPSDGSKMEEPDDVESLYDWLRVNFKTASLPIVIAIDEAGAIADSKVRNALFGQFREIHSLSADAAPDDISRRVRFVFAGTFRPADLVRPENSPFNICQQILSEDLSLADARALAKKVQVSIEPYVERAFSYVGGQPYLLQTVFKQMVELGSENLDSNLDTALNELEHTAYGHIAGILSQILANEQLSDLVRRILAEGAIPWTPGNLDHQYAEVLGVSARTGNKLTIRNEFYKLVLSSSPQLEPEGSQVVSPSAPSISTANRTVLASRQDPDFAHMSNPYLSSMVLSQHNAAVFCNAERFFCLALTGFGSATEALLLDFFLSSSPSNLAKAVADGKAETDAAVKVNFSSNENHLKPETWRFVNMINIARQYSDGIRKMNPSHALRDWRNLVHPAKAYSSAVNEASLESECIAAVGLFGIILRDTKAIYGTWNH